MTRRSAVLPALLYAGALLLATALTASSYGPSLAGPLLLTLAIVAADLIERRRWLPSREAVILGVTVAVASALLLPDRQALAAMLPILGGSVGMLPLIRTRGVCRAELTERRT